MSHTISTFFLSCLFSSGLFSNCSNPNSTSIISKDLINRHVGEKIVEDARISAKKFLCIKEDFSIVVIDKSNLSMLTTDSQLNGSDIVLNWLFESDSKMRENEKISKNQIVDHLSRHGSFNRAISHELGHLLFTKYLMLNKYTPGEYGSDAPDFIDEMAAIAFEDGYLSDRRRRVFFKEFENGQIFTSSGLLKVRRGMGSLPTLSKDNVTEQNIDFWSEATQTVIEGKYHPGKNELFYAQTRVMLDYLIHKTEEECVIADIGNTLVNGGTFKEWVNKSQTMPIILLSFMQTHQKKVTDSIIETATVKLKNYSDSIELIGRVEPRNSYTVIAPISGKVATIFVENGEMVEIGTKLLKLDSDDVKARISKKSISIQEQDATVRSVLQSIDSEKFKFKKNVLNLKGEILTLDDDIKNKRILSLEGFISKSSVVELQNRRDRKAELLELEIESYESLKVHTSKKLVSSKAKLTQLKKDLSLLNDKLTSAEVTSKFSGQLVHFNPTLGDQIGENSIIGQIQSFDGFQVSANVDQYYLRHFEFGEKAKDTINGKEGIFTLSRLNPTVVDGHFVATWEASDDTKHNVTGGQNVSSCNPP